MKYDVAVVGGGMAGLTSAAYLCSNGYKVVLCEQQAKTGGLVNSFTHNGFVLDGGIRAIENSGIIFPMLKQLGIEVEFVQNTVSLIIGQQHLRIQPENFLQDYRGFMQKLFPQDNEAVDKLVREIEKAMRYMDVLYGFDNPLFVNLQEDVGYALSLLPWLCKYLATIGKIDRLTMPVYEYLGRFSSNSVLNDMFAQHFFYKTPAFFALSYFSLYMDYRYPRGGTGALADKMLEYCTAKGAEVRLNCKISHVDCAGKTLTDAEGNQIEYKKLIWAADTKQLYRALDPSAMQQGKAKNRILRHKALLRGKTGSDSIFTVYLMLNAAPEQLAKHMSPHVFYTPELRGLSAREIQEYAQRVFTEGKITGTKQQLLEWAEQVLRANTFEISCPAMRDASLAPEGQAALIISCLFEYSVMKQVRKQGFYEEFKLFCENTICDIVLHTLLKDFAACKMHSFSSSPLTIQGLTSNTGGSVTGWGFGNTPVPAVTKMSKIADTIKTPVPDVYQAGQWTFAPSGLPIAVLTGKLAADKVHKELK